MAKLDMQVEPKIIFQSKIGPRALRKAQGPWKIFGVLDSADATVAWRELQGGATGLVLKTLESVGALRDLPLHTFSIRNEAGDAAARALVELISKKPIDPARLDICFGVSNSDLAPLGFAGPFTTMSSPADDIGEILLGAIKWSSQTHVSVKLVAHHHLFQTLAKFRAMRILWQRAFPNVELNLHAETATPFGDSAEHYMLRCVSACMGAGLGGADSIAILPFKSEGEIDRRIARNIQNILLRESHIGEAADAATGSGYVEQLTQEICDVAWERFQS
jgi:hypothetical protein